MSKTGIEWTGATWNPIVGCSIVSPGCTNCYAMKMAARLEAMGTLPHYAGTARSSKGGAVWTGKLALAPERTLMEPLRRHKPITYFVNSMGDLFHEDVPDEWIDRIFAIMALCPQHTFQVLTKRSARMRFYMEDPERKRTIAATVMSISCALALAAGSHEARITLDHFSACFAGSGPFPNVWLGVSAEDQRRADERIPDLLATPAAIRFVSAEPLLGAIDFTRLDSDGIYRLDALSGLYRDRTGAVIGNSETRLNWIIVGGESGPGARPMHPDWARQIRDQCAAAGTAFFFKQWGTWAPALDRDRDDPDWRADYSNRFSHSGEHRWINLAGGSGFHGDRFHVMRRVAKPQAGRLLDGTQHDAMPELR